MIIYIIKIKFYTVIKLFFKRLNKIYDLFKK